MTKCDFSLQGRLRRIVGGSVRAVACAFGMVLLLLAGSCKKPTIEEQAMAFPDDIAPLMRKTCATTGCHTAQSAAAAAGLNLETWEGLFQGSRGGSAVVPYAPDFSFLLYSVNTDTNIGPVLEPTMPYNEETISTEEYQMLWDWIDQGAPNALGAVRFPDRADRRKWYIGHNDCDYVAVFDAESRQTMRYISVGPEPNALDYAFDVQVSPDGKDWFVVFLSTGSIIERYSTLNDEKIADNGMGNYGCNTMGISHDSRFAFVANDYFQELAVIDLHNNSVVDTHWVFAHEMVGPTVHPMRNEVYMPQLRRQSMYVLDFDAQGSLSNLREVGLVQGVPPAVPGFLEPLEVLFLPDGSKYFVTCWRSNEIRVFDAQNDSILDVIALPNNPGKMAYSATTNRIFVTCMNDAASWGGAPNKLGSVVAIDAGSHQIQGTIYSGYQPYALRVDDASGVVVVANRNTDTDGPAPHHQSTCGDRNGYVTLIDLQSLDLISDYKPELLADPITVAVK